MMLELWIFLVIFYCFENQSYFSYIYVQLILTQAVKFYLSNSVKTRETGAFLIFKRKKLNVKYADINSKFWFYKIHYSNNRLMLSILQLLRLKLKVHTLQRFSLKVGKKIWWFWVNQYSIFYKHLGFVGKLVDLNTNLNTSSKLRFIYSLQIPSILVWNWSRLFIVPVLKPLLNIFNNKCVYTEFIIFQGTYVVWIFLVSKSQ